MCSIDSPVSCVVGPVISGSVSEAASSAWDEICQSFADAASTLLIQFAKAFVAIPDVDLSSHGLRNVYAISLGLAAFVAVLLLLGQVIRTAVTHDGSALATGLVGVGKAALAFMLTLSVASTALVASDQISDYIVRNTFGSTKAFSAKLAKLIAWDSGTSGSLLLIFGVIGILLTAVLWFEMLLRNAAIAVLIGTSPIAAAGMLSEGTKGWWSKLVSSTVQLIALKPIVALVFALGFGLAGDSQDLETTLSGMLVLLLAVLCWPAIARFFSFASVQVGGAAGLGALLGFAGGRMSARAGGDGGAPVGISPDEFGAVSAERTMARHASLAGASGAAAVAGPVGMVATAGVRMAQQAVNSLAGGFEKMAGHAGMQGANPHAAPAGHVPRYGVQPPSTGGSGWQQPAAQGAQARNGEPSSGAAPQPSSVPDVRPDPAADLPVTAPPQPLVPSDAPDSAPPASAPPPIPPTSPDPPAPQEGGEPQ